ncbi:DUF3558 domain-containing protein [Amycolatopsis taiwanensis]|nr:DUF3558 domain-containing protein [Amycolatopsis taiwanensis]
MAMLAVAGCTQTSGGGTPSPSSGAPATGNTASSARPSTAGGANTAPAITNPLDVSKFMADPCLSITSAQAAKLTISSQGQRLNVDIGEACDWKYGTNLEFDVGVSYIIPEGGNGLQNLYNQKAAGQYDQGYFEPTTIDGYPAVYEEGSDNRPKGQCSLSVGINEQTFITVLNNGSGNVCGGTEKIASAVVETIKRG